MAAYYLQMPHCPRRARRSLVSWPTVAGRASLTCGFLVLLTASLASERCVAQSAPQSPTKRQDAGKSKKKLAPPKSPKSSVTTPQAPPPALPRAQHDEGETKPARGAETPLDTSASPPHLPAASREKMHACAVEWTKLKQTTRGTLPLWRDFASACLTR